MLKMTFRKLLENIKNKIESTRRENIRTTPWDIKTFPKDIGSDFVNSKILLQILNYNKCVNCNEVDCIAEGPHGGCAVNLVCNKCGQKYWASAGFGAHVYKQLDKNLELRYTNE